MLSAQSAGKIVIGAYGSEALPFSTDPIYDDDPHRTICGQLQSAGGGYLWPGDTEVIHVGAAEQVEEIYARALEIVIAFNEQRYDYFPLGIESLGPNGNSFYAVLTQQIQEQIDPNRANDFNPWGIDFGINWTDENLNIPPSNLPSEQLEGYINKLEETLLTQIENFTSAPHHLLIHAPHQ
jgi:hypothetical protein